MKPETKKTMIRVTAVAVSALLGAGASTAYHTSAPGVTQAQFDALTKHVDALKACPPTKLTLTEPLPLKVLVIYPEKKK